MSSDSTTPVKMSPLKLTYHIETLPAVSPNGSRSDHYIDEGRAASRQLSPPRIICSYRLNILERLFVVLLANECRTKSTIW